MRGRRVGFCCFACWRAAAAAREKSTDELIGDLKSGKEEEGVIAARTLPMGRGDAAKVVPALIEALSHKGQRRPSQLRPETGPVPRTGQGCHPRPPEGGAGTTLTPGSAKRPASPCRASIRKRFPYTPKVGGRR